MRSSMYIFTSYTLGILRPWHFLGTHCIQTPVLCCSVFGPTEAILHPSKLDAALQNRNDFINRIIEVACSPFHPHQGCEHQASQANGLQLLADELKEKHDAVAALVSLCQRSMHSQFGGSSMQIWIVNKARIATFLWETFKKIRKDLHIHFFGH